MCHICNGPFCVTNVTFIQGNIFGYTLQSGLPPTAIHFYRNFHKFPKENFKKILEKKRKKLNDNLMVVHRNLKLR